MMLSLGKHTTSRDIEENSTSCYLHIPFDPSAEEGGGSVLIYAYSKYPSISTNFKFLVIKCKKKKTFHLLQTCYYHQKRLYAGSQSGGS